jgi:hypothetical protein
VFITSVHPVLRTTACGLMVIIMPIPTTLFCFGASEKHAGASLALVERRSYRVCRCQPSGITRTPLQYQLVAVSLTESTSHASLSDPAVSIKHTACINIDHGHLFRCLTCLPGC